MNNFRKPPQQSPHLINGMIRAANVLVVYKDESQNINQQMSLRAAIELAESIGLDLVQMNQETVPTCKLMDYSKHLFALKKKKKQEMQSNKTIIKEIALRPCIDTNDLGIKAKQVHEFLSKGWEVKVKLSLNRRERAHAEAYSAVLTKFVDEFASIARIQPGGSPGLFSLKPIIKK